MTHYTRSTLALLLIGRILSRRRYCFNVARGMETWTEFMRGRYLPYTLHGRR